MNITLPTSSASDIGAQVTGGLSTYSPLVILIVGLVLAFFIFGAIIEVIKTNKSNEK